MKLTQSKILCFCLVLFGVGFGRHALAYGHFQNLTSNNIQATLTYASINRHQINFCVSVDPASASDFPDASIEQQTRMALSLWLKPVSDDIKHGVSINRVDCNADNLDLKVDVSPKELLGNNLPVCGKTNFVKGAKKYYALVRLNTSFDIGDNGTIYDFNSIVLKHNLNKEKVTLQKAMDDANLGKKQVADIHAWANVDDVVAATSSYPNLLHEIGHAFGLCDTNDNQFGKSANNCDMNFVSSQVSQDDSVMKSANYFYITKDDDAGVRSLVDRFYTTSNVQVASNAANHASGGSPEPYRK